MPTIISNELINKIVDPYPYSTWLNSHTIRQMEVKVVKAKRLHFRRFARFRADYRSAEFMIWPICYIYSWRIRFRQRRIRIFAKVDILGRYGKLLHWLDRHGL